MRVHPNNPEVRKKMPQIKQLIMNTEVKLYFLPSSELKEQVAKNEHPYVKDMPASRKADILSGQGIMVQKKLVLDWLEGNLNDKNCWVLEQGDIRVIDSSISLLNVGD